MNEFLSENVRRAYPLSRELPSGVDARWLQTLVDASISYVGILASDETLALLSVRRNGTSAVFRVGVLSSAPPAPESSGDASDSGASASSDSGSEQEDPGYAVDVSVSSGLSAYATVYAASTRLKVFLSVNGPAVSALLSGNPVDAEPTTVNIPFALRCTSSAIRRVTSVAAYTPERCTTPVFDDEPRTPIRTLTDELRLAAKDGVDLERLTDPAVGDVLRISAVTAPRETTEADKTVDLMLRGDACFSVETLPGVVLVNGVPTKGSEVDPPVAETGAGLIRISSKCKPCCQCEDYKAAVDALRPAEASVISLEDILRNVKRRYDAAVATFDELTDEAKDKINSYENVHAQATAVCSGGIYSGSMATGKRSRITVTLTIINMTLDTASVTGVQSFVPGFAPVRVRWSLAGINPRGGDSLISQAWLLWPGDTLSVSWTYARSDSTNEAVKPTGMSSGFTVKLTTRSESQTRSVEVT